MVCVCVCGCVYLCGYVEGYIWISSSLTVDNKTELYQFDGWESFPLFLKFVSRMDGFCEILNHCESTSYYGLYFVYPSVHSLQRALL